MNSRSGKKHTIEEMIQNEEIMAQGQAELTLKLNEQSASAALAHFLRSYRGRTDQARLVQHPDRLEKERFSGQLEQARHALFVGNVAAAEKTIADLKPGNELEQCEAAVEKCRLLLLREEYLAATELATMMLLNPVLCELSRMTCFQMRGQAKLMLNDAQGSIEDFLHAIALSEIYSHAGSGFTAKGYLVCAYLKAGQVGQAEHYLAALRREIDALESDELWLTRALIWVRTETHYYRHLGNSHDLTARLLESREFASWIGDLRILRRTEREIEELGCVGCEGERDFSHFGIQKYSGWMFIARHSLVLSFSPKKVARLDRSPVMEKMIRTLAPGPLTLEQFFEAIWKIKFDPERHALHTRAALSKLRKILPEGALVVRDGLITLT